MANIKANEQYIPKELLKNDEVAKHNREVELLIRDVEYENRAKRRATKRIQEMEGKLLDVENKAKNLQGILKQNRNAALGENTKLILQAELEGERAKHEVMTKYLAPEIKKLAEKVENHQKAVRKTQKAIATEERALEGYIRTA